MEISGVSGVLKLDAIESINTTLTRGGERRNQLPVSGFADGSQSPNTIFDTIHLSAAAHAHLACGAPVEPAGETQLPETGYASLKALVDGA